MMTASNSGPVGWVALDEIVVTGRFRSDLGDVSELADSIARVGLLHPLVITADRRLVAGARRLAACRQLGWTHAPVHVVAGLDDAAALLIAERDENTCRKAMTPEEKIALGIALEQLERPKAKARQQASGPASAAKRQGRADGPVNVTEASTGSVRDLVGAAVGMSGPTISAPRRSWSWPATAAPRPGSR